MSPATERCRKRKTGGGTAARLTEHGADWITFTSGSTVEHFHTRFDLPLFLKRFPQTRLASIGPETSKALAVLNLQPTVEARFHTIDGLIESLTGATRTGLTPEGGKASCAGAASC